MKLVFSANMRKGSSYIFLMTLPNTFTWSLNGRVKIGNCTNDGEEIVRSILSKGEVFGELALACEAVRTDFAQVMDDNTQLCLTGVEDM